MEEVKEGEMPMGGYTFIHKEAQLTEAQKTLLVEWFGSLRKSNID
ncbi:MAG: heme-binding domain-containing protein [Cytophagales bacterium]